MFERVYFETAGDGYWSDVAKEVDIEDMQLSYCSDEMDFGELRACPDCSTRLLGDGIQRLAGATKVREIFNKYLEGGWL